MTARAGVKLRPTVERERLWRLVLDLRKEGLSYNQIIRKVEAEQGAKLGKSQLSGWINGKHKPFGYVRAFDAKPRPELAYVIGAALGDGSTSSNRNHDHMIKLRVTDEDFAEEFARCLAVILIRDRPRVKWHEKTHAWHVQVSSLLLLQFLRSDLEDLAPTIEHCDSCKGAFLRGFFDSEGSISGRQITASNGDLEKLRFVNSTLHMLGIETTGPHLAKKKGGKTWIKGHQWNVNKDSFYIYVRTISLQDFRTKVGFAIFRKSRRLDEALG